MHPFPNRIFHSLEHLNLASLDDGRWGVWRWVLSIWRTLNSSIFFARLFSIICSVASIKLFAGLAHRLFDKQMAILVTAFFAMHPFLIWASLEIRVYALVILLSVLLLKLFFESFMEWGDPRFGDAVSKKVLELIHAKPQAMLFDFLMEQPEDTRRASVVQFTQGSKELAERIEVRRTRDKGESKETRRNLQNAMLMINEKDHILACVALVGIPDKPAFDIMRDNAHAIMDGTPT